MGIFLIRRMAIAASRYLRGDANLAPNRLEYADRSSAAYSKDAVRVPVPHPWTTFYSGTQRRP
jgi:hypothetical protein